MTMVESNRVVSALRLNVYRGVRTVVKDISFRMYIGECVAVLGANGAGKSSLLAALAGECSKPKRRSNSGAFMSGELMIDRSILSSLSSIEMARVRAVLPQHSTLSFNLAVEEVVQMGAYPYPEAKPEQVSQWIAESLIDADLADLSRSKYSELSGGEQQRVQFARVLVQARSIAYFQGHAWLFLDEPSASLDPRHQQLLMHKIHSLVRTGNFGVVIIMHDLNLAAHWCDRVLLMKAGTLIADDTPFKAFTAETLFECFETPMQVMQHPCHVNKLIVVAN